MDFHAEAIPRQNEKSWFQWYLTQNTAGPVAIATFAIISNPALATVPTHHYKRR